MTISLQTPMIELERTLIHLTQLFFPYKKVSNDIDEGITITIQIPTETQIKIVDQRGEKDFYQEQAVNAALKKRVSLFLYQALSEYTGLKPPWGILTGIRPTKLVHDIKTGWEQKRTELSEQYLIADEKLTLLREITQVQLEKVPDMHDLLNKREVSIYVGIPFCPTKCAYCTFPAYDIKGHEGNVPDFLNSLFLEIQRVGTSIQKNQIKITSLYIGGGTPTSLEAWQLELLFTHLSTYLSFSDIREITVEAGRPDTITLEKLNVLKKWGIDRISVNPQTYKQDTLDIIGRHHTVQESIDKYRLAYESGVKNINMDLIIGLPGETLEDFSYSLLQTEILNPTSITVHSLAFKRASFLTKQNQQSETASFEEIQQMMTKAQNWTRAHQYRPYYLYRQKNIVGNLENVGYALPGQESIYNIIIMEEVQTIVGIGAGAASKWIDPVTKKIYRTTNPKEPRAYSEQIEKYIMQKLECLNTYVVQKS